MAEPIDLQIVLALRDALQEIRVSDDYHYDVAEYQVKLDPDHAVEALLFPEGPNGPRGPRPFVIIEVREDSVPASDGSPMRVEEASLNLTLNWCHMTNPEEDDSLLTTYFRGLADLERAIYASHPLNGGIAKRVDIVRRAFHGLPQSDVWALMDLSIPYRRALGEPAVN